ncbi:MAG: FAD-dependent oxidoreductase [Myxococcota bacterium]|nr:FAD-dependent oxidoreductase [Myxococcota bacterium]
MAASDRFDVVVVGGGPAGLSCARETAAAGLSTALFERGEECGAKNVSGGRLYLGPLADLPAGFWKDVPLERRVVRETLTLVSGAATASIDLRSPRLGEAPVESHTVLRARFDRWLAERTAEAGAMVVPGARVDGVLLRDGRAIGVRLGADEIEAGVVVAADGALSRIALAAGIGGPPRPDRLAIGVKEIVALDPGRIEDRFGLEPGEGAARLVIGDPTRGIPGGGFLYTNRDSISVGVVAKLDALGAAGPGGPETHALIEALRAVPEVARLLAGGETAEYSAHLVPELSVDDAPRRSMPGLIVVGDAAGLVVNHGFTVRGMDLAIASGVIAGRAIAQAARGGDPATAAPALYERGLKESFVMRDMEAARRSIGFLSRDRLYSHYPRAVCALLEEVFSFGPGGKGKTGAALWKSARTGFLNLRGLADLWAMRRI